VQFGATSAVGFGSQSFTEATSNVAPVAAESLVTNVSVCAVFIGPDEVSFSAVGPGITVGVMVADVVCGVVPVSETWYLTGIETVPVKLGIGSKVTTPVVGLTVYVPSAVVSVVSAQFGDTWAGLVVGSQSFTVAGFSGSPAGFVGTVSLTRTLIT